MRFFPIVNNPVAIVDRQSDAVHFLHCIGFARCFHIRSDDDGVTFSKPVEIYERNYALTLARFNLEWLTEGKDRLP